MEKPRLRYAQATDQSLYHDVNHDALLALTMHGVSNFGLSDVGFFMIAGGDHNSGSGAQAASLATQTAGYEITRHLYRSSVSRSDHQSADTMRDLLIATFQEANRAVLNQHPNSFTSAAALLVIDEQVHMASTGGIGVYLMTESEIEQLAQEEPTAEDQRPAHALGIMPDIEVETVQHGLPRNSRLVIFKSGLPAWQINDVPETLSSFQDIAMHQANLKRAAGMLVTLARSQDSQDDISLILVKATG